MFAIASSCENPRWVQEVESRGGMTRKEWADFVDRNFNPPKQSKFRLALLQELWCRSLLGVCQLPGSIRWHIT